MSLPTCILLCLGAASALLSARAAHLGVQAGRPAAETFDREAACARLQLLAGEYAVNCEQGRFGITAGCVVAAERLIEVLLGGAVDVEPAWLRLEEEEWPVYHDFMVDRAEHQVRTGNLQGADSTYRTALEFLEHIPRSVPEWGVWQRRTLNNRAIVLNLAGRNRASTRHYAMAKPLVDSGASSQIVAANLIRAEVRKGGDVDVAIQKLEEIRQRLRDRGSLSAAVAVHQKLASTLSEAGRSTEALAAFDTLVAESRAHGLRNRLAEALYWRAKARERHDFPGAEEDYIESLDFFRAQGVKPREARVYHRYAIFLYDQGRFAEGLEVIEECLRLLRNMGAIWNEPEYAGVKPSILLKLGRVEEADEVWAGILEQVQQVRAELDSTQLRLVLWWRGHYLARVRRLDALAPLREMAQEWAEEDLLEAEDLDSIVAFIDESQQGQLEVGLEESPSVFIANKEVVAKSSLIELQPVWLMSSGTGNGPVRAWFWLVNPTAETRSGELSVAGLGENPTWDQKLPGFLRIESGDATEADGMSFPIPVLLEPYGSQAVQVVSDPPGMGERARVILNWKGGNGMASSEWNLIASELSQTQAATIRTSLSLRNGFHALPIYHEIGWEGLPGPWLMNFRVKASQPCRVEVYEQPAKGLIAVDAQADGSFSGSGDLLNRDADRSGYPEAADGILPIIAYVFPLSGVSYTEPLKVSIEVQSSGGWAQWGSDWVFEFNR